jgi:hypothetical protein
LAVSSPCKQERHAMRLARFLALAVISGLGICYVTAAEDDDKAIKEAVLKLAAAVEKSDKDVMKKLVEELKKHELEHVMDVFKKTPVGLDVVGKEGIENKIRSLSKKVTAADVKSNGENYEKMAQIIAAVAEVATVKCPVEEKKGDKDPKKWAEWIKEMKDGAKALGEASKAKDAKKVSDAAKKLNSACNECHGVFRDN